MESLFLHVLWTSPSWGRRNQGIQTSKAWSSSLACSDPSWSSAGSWDSFIAPVAGLAPIVNWVWTCHHLYLMVRSLRIVIFGVHLNSMWSYAITAWCCGSFNSCLIQLPLPSCLGPRKQKNLYQAKEDTSQFVGAEITGHRYTEDALTSTGACSVKQGLFREQLLGSEKSLPSMWIYYVKGS